MVEAWHQWAVSLQCWWRCRDIPHVLAVSLPFIPYQFDGLSSGNRIRSFNSAVGYLSWSSCFWIKNVFAFVFQCFPVSFYFSRRRARLDPRIIRVRYGVVKEALGEHFRRKCTSIFSSKYYSDCAPYLYSILHRRYPVLIIHHDFKKQ